MILICYDGSADAQAAIDRAATLMPGAEATVLVVWETMLETLSRSGSLGLGLEMIGDYGDTDSDAQIEHAALDTAQQGAHRATAAGLRAEARVAQRDGNITAVVLAVAAAVKAEAIVVGTRGRGDVKSMLLGSVSQSILHHADRPVLVVPSPETCERRVHQLEPARATADAR